MSVKETETEMLEKKVVVNEGETAQLVELEEETKKAKAIKVAKKVGKVVGVGLVGLLGYFIGTKVGGKNSEYDDSDDIEVDEYEMTDEE